MKDVYLGNMKGKTDSRREEKLSREMGYSRYKEKMHFSFTAKLPSLSTSLPHFILDFPGLLMLIF